MGVPPQVFKLHTAPITCHAFNADRSRNVFHIYHGDVSLTHENLEVAVSPNGSDLKIYQLKNKALEQTHTLDDHDKVITSVDWAPKSNRIVTCSQDRNAYVWTYDAAQNEWKPTLVLLRLNRAATFVKWSPNEDKFAVASGARAIAICYFEEDGDWFVSKHLKKPIRSTVLSLDWHPNNVLIASGSADMKARVFSAFIKDIESRPESSVWGSRLPFNTLCAEYLNESGGWVHSVAFSCSGNALAFAGHDSSISIAYPAENGEDSQALHVIKTTQLPFTNLLWTSEEQIIAAGFDCQPFAFRGNEKGWRFLGSLDATRSIVSPSSEGPSAMSIFRNMDRKGKFGDESKSGTESTVHQNTVTIYAGEAGFVTKFSSSALDGRIAVWNVEQDLTNQLGGLNVAS